MSTEISELSRLLVFFLFLFLFFKALQLLNYFKFFLFLTNWNSFFWEIDLAFHLLLLYTFPVNNLPFPISSHCSFRRFVLQCYLSASANNHSISKSGLGNNFGLIFAQSSSGIVEIAQFSVQYSQCTTDFTCPRTDWGYLKTLPLQHQIHVIKGQDQDSEIKDIPTTHLISQPF